MKNNQDESSITEEDIEEALHESFFKRKRGSKSKAELMAMLPEQLFIVPITRRPFFPGMATPIVFEPGEFYEVLKIVAKSEEKVLGLFLTKNESTKHEDVKKEDIYEVGILARIVRILPIESGGAQVVLSMENRISVKKFVKSKHLAAKVKHHIEAQEKLTKELKAYAISIITTIRELLPFNPLFKEELQIFLGHSDFTEPGKLADFAVALTTASREELQEVLETFDLQSRIDKALVLLKKELDISRLQSNIRQKTEASVANSQREFLLRQQLQTIKKELGIEKEDKSSDLEKFETRLKQRVVPEPVMQTIREEMDKLQALEVQSSEYAVCRNYLDWLTILPWGIYSDANNEGIDLSFAKKTLEKDHYGLDEIKERILEFIAVGKLSRSMKGNIICFVGPPGTGKTSIGKSIARALKRPFYRFSVGGMRDEAEIKGHRRTYIGAMPGKFVQALKLTQAMDPVIMIDEVDKLVSSYQGDPGAALLEVLDPEQNSDFLDHYLDVRLDLSKTLFLLTGNVSESIPIALKDRMETLRLSGYILEEKLQIARKYLIPRNRSSMGLKPAHLMIPVETITAIVNEYARESGVRGLEKQLKKILRKVALMVVRAEQRKRKNSAFNKQIIQAKALSKLLGKPEFSTDEYYKNTPIGVCRGLAWTAMGGVTLYVEAIAVKSEKLEMKITGQPGDVMKESSQIAWSYLHHQAARFAPEQGFFENHQVHLHIPEGAIPKDGPSAGITMTTAILSLLRKEAVMESLGMTGEITLTGKVLPIGGVKEKVLAAQRAKTRKLIFPKGNRQEYEMLPAHVTKNITVYFVESYEEVFAIAFPNAQAGEKR